MRRLRQAWLNFTIRLGCTWDAMIEMLEAMALELRDIVERREAKIKDLELRCDLLEIEVTQLETENDNLGGALWPESRSDV